MEHQPHHIISALFLGINPPPLSPPPRSADYGFDPLGLGSEPEQLRWNVQSEVFHARTAMTAVAGILAVSILHGANPAVPQWYDAGKVYLEQNPNVSLGALIWTTIALSGFVEFKRLADWRKPGSQADQWFLGIQKEFKVSQGVG